MGSIRKKMRAAKAVLDKKIRGDAPVPRAVKKRLQNMSPGGARETTTAQNTPDKSASASHTGDTGRDAPKTPLSSSVKNTPVEHTFSVINTHDIEQSILKAAHEAVEKIAEKIYHATPAPTGVNDSVPVFQPENEGTSRDTSEVKTHEVSDTSDVSSGAKTPDSAPVPAPVSVPAPAFTPASEPAVPAAVADMRDGGEPTKQPSSQSRRPLIFGVAAAFVFIAAYIGTAAATSSTVPDNVTVAGVDIGGLEKNAAIKKLEKELSADSTRRYELVLGTTGVSVDVQPERYNLTLDAKSTVDTVAGFSLKPTSVYAHLFGGQPIEPSVSYDEEALALTLQNIQAHVKDGYQNASISFDGLKPRVVPSKKGSGFETAIARRQLTSGIYGSGEKITFALKKMPAPITDKQAEKAIETYARPLVAAPVTVTFAGQDYEFTPDNLAKAASFVDVNNELALVLDGDALAGIIESTEPEGIVFGQDAQIKIVNHERVEIIPSTDGKGIDRGKLVDDIKNVIKGDNAGERRVEAKLGVAPARFTTQDAEDMGVKEIIASIDTPHNSGYNRKMNLIVGAERSSGTLVKPGETFSLLETIGPVTLANGYYSAGMVVGGYHVDGAGGGLSQITTNTFNLGFQAGYVDVEHHPHTNYFTRYPKGHEATLSDPELDMKWTNNTPYGAVIDTWVDGGYVHSRLWSTKYWDVTIETSPMRNVRSATVVTRPAGPNCTSYGAGHSGFSITVTRTGRHGDEEWTESKVVDYAPDNGVRCVAPKPSPTRTPSPTP